nr:wall-associated receptor kinase 2 [Quercus suber]
MPMVLDWAIGNETCNDVEKKSNYICGDNSSCQNSEDSSGYRCKCKDGYDGNPYLPNGCQGGAISQVLGCDIGGALGGAILQVLGGDLSGASGGAILSVLGCDKTGAI